MGKRKAGVALAPSAAKTAASTVEEVVPRGNLGAWERVLESRFQHSVAVDREVDEDDIERLLDARSAAKEAKNWVKADEIAAMLQDRDVCYVDEKRIWYTRAISSEQDKAKREKKKRKTGDKEKAVKKGKKKSQKQAKGKTPTRPEARE